MSDSNSVQEVILGLIIFMLVSSIVFLTIYSLTFYDKINKEDNIQTSEQSNMSGVVSIYSQQDEYVSQGSGFIYNYNKKQYIITSSHVVKNRDTVQIEYKSEKWVTGEVIGTHLRFDVAVIKPQKNIFKSSYSILSKNNLDKGEQVRLIGNNGDGEKNSIVTGYISNTNIELNSVRDLYIPKGIQIDKQVNSGYSGGPVLRNNTIVGMIKSSSKGKTNTISTDMLRLSIKMIVGDKKRNYIGIQSKNISPLDSSDIDRRMIKIEQVRPESPAENVLKQGDIIVKYNKESILTREELFRYILNEDSDSVSLTIIRNGSKETVELSISKIKYSDYI